MKKKDLERKLREWGFTQGHGGEHDSWVNKNGLKIPVPRHTELKEGTARAILKKAEKNKTN